MDLPDISQSYEDPYTYPQGIAYMDGQYLDISRARVSILDYGFLHSDATYDVVHVWNGSFFRIELYLERFFANMGKLHLQIPYGRREVAKVLHNCVALSGHRNAYVEMICTRGTSPFSSRDPRECINRFMAFAIPFGSIANPGQMERGLHATISPVTRIPACSVDPTIKNYHWLDMIQSLYHAYDQGGETTFLLSQDGTVAEGPGFNIFCVSNDQVITPAQGVLMGVTRQTVFDLCKERGIKCMARPLAVSDLEAADEIFITSTAGGLMPVTMLGKIPVGPGKPGKKFLELKQAYWDKHASPDWTTKVHYGQTP